jgi:thiamine pyrophosphate-dependent acetolactate synthase large subunit-like protein
MMVDALADRGATAVFGLIGEGNMLLLNAITADGRLTYHAARHESAAVGMADGFARATGRLGVVTVTQGPGFTNAITALMTAARGRSRLVGVIPDIAADVPWHLQSCDVVGLARAAGLTVITMTRTTVTATLHAAVDHALSANEVVLVRYAFPILGEPADQSQATTLPQPAGRRVVAADKPSVEAAARALMSASTPLILAGHGARVSGATSALTELASLTDAWLATTLPAKGLFSDHPRNLGICGGFTRPEDVAQFRRSDCVAAFGASLNQYTTRSGSLFSGARTVIHCDESADSVSRVTRADLALVGDARETAEALCAALVQLGAEPEMSAAPLEERTVRGAQVIPSQGRAGYVDPVALLGALDGLLPDRRIVVAEPGHNTGFVARALAVNSERGFIIPIDFGSIGLALGQAMGAAVAVPDSTVVCTIGDGSLLMSLGELESAVQCGGRLLIVVLDDSSYAAEYHALVLEGRDVQHSVYPEHDFAATARALGMNAHTVRSLDDLRTTAGELDDLPLLLDCKVDRRVRGDWLTAHR